MMLMPLLLRWKTLDGEQKRVNIVDRIQVAAPRRRN